MICTDPVSDLLTRVRNAQKAGIDVVAVPASGMKIGIVNILKEEGFVRNFKCIRDGKQGMIKIALKYVDNPETGGKSGVIRQVKRVSKPGRRVYVNADSIPFTKNGFGLSILSTSQGLMVDREARSRHIGGEILCQVF